MIWRRLRGLFGDRGPDDSDKSVASEVMPATVSGTGDAAPEAPHSPEARLRALASADLLADPAEVIELASVVADEGRVARALDALRAWLDRASVEQPGRATVVLRAAELLAMRGDDSAAANLLEPLVARLDGPVGATMLAAEIAERRGDAARALALYQKVIALDLDFPRARERSVRLRQLADVPREGLAGMTLATEGALTRGRYRVEHELGRGGAGTVFAAVDQRLGRRVALKIYHGRGPVERERSRRRWSTLASFAS